MNGKQFLDAMLCFEIPHPITECRECKYRHMMKQVAQELINEGVEENDIVPIWSARIYERMECEKATLPTSSCKKDTK